jgi:hypothetical protein
MTDAGSPEARLKAFEGEWTGEETLHPTPWAPGGSAQGRWTFHLDSSGRYLVHDYSEERQGGARFDGHGVLTPAQDGAGYLWFWFDSLGYIPTPPGTGSWDGNTLTLIRTSPRGSNRSVFTFAGDRFTLDISFRGAADPVDTPVMSGTFQRGR